MGSSPSQVYLVPSRNLIFGADLVGGLLEQFTFDGAGRTAAAAAPRAAGIRVRQHRNTATPRLPLGLWGHPKQPLLYVGYVTAKKMSVHRYGPTGELRFLHTVPNAGIAICWIRSNSSGTRLYTTDTASNQISVYDASDLEYPVEIQTFTLEGVGNAYQLSLSVDEKTLYSISQRATGSLPEGQGNVLHTLAVLDDGTVAEKATTILFKVLAGVRPQGLAVAHQ